jgi:hypothetical protein
MACGLGRVCTQPEDGEGEAGLVGYPMSWEFRGAGGEGIFANVAKAVDEMGDSRSSPNPCPLLHQSRRVTTVLFTTEKQRFGHF